MSISTADTTVSRSVVVDAPPARAFKVFTEEIASWWPRDHHILDGELAETVFEPRVGGNLYDLGADGSECRWATVLAYEPPSRILFSWDITVDWKIETDRQRTSEVEVRFLEENAGRTLVELEHRYLERHGEGWERKRDGVGGDDGWGLILREFADAAGRAKG